MDKEILFKGFEVELFTGTQNSHVGISSEIEKVFPNFVMEPDNRNIEYITDPDKSYKVLYKSLLEPRKKLRKWLREKNLTIIPSSTLCFEHDYKFQRSDPYNAYHDFIESNYGISIATSSVHINLGIDNLIKLFAAIRLARCEASLYLALSASSPFLNGKFTGHHSQRWMQFPKTPLKVPFFVDHQQYINWVENNIKNGQMQNIRHFWSSIRPNGPMRPYKLDRLELRICDFVSEINLLLAITAFLELRILLLFQDMQVLDPLTSSKFTLSELQNICDHNELEVAKKSLDGELIHWKDGKSIICRDWIQNLLGDISNISKKYNMCKKIEPLYKVLEKGNQSINWINQYNSGYSIEEIIKSEINDMEESE